MRNPRKRRDRISLEIRDKYKDDPEAIKHAAMILVSEENVNAGKVHQHILDDSNSGDIFMDAFNNKAKESATKMPKITALAFLLNEVISRNNYNITYSLFRKKCSTQYSCKNTSKLLSFPFSICATLLFSLINALFYVVICYRTEHS